MTADLLAGIASGWRRAIDLVTPGLCLVCEAPLAEPASLCAVCWTRLRPIDAPVCEAMGTPFAYDEGNGALSAAAIAEPPVWTRARAAVAYDEASKPIVHALKYGDRQEAGLLMARMMALAGRELLSEAEVIVPVPLHRWRLWQRRFNQSAFLARALAEKAGRRLIPDALLRNRRTRSQVGLSQNERRRNVSGAFAAHGGRLAELSGKRVLLVDDVLTTGATASACASVLVMAGASKVDVLTFGLVLEARHIHI